MTRKVNTGQGNKRVYYYCRTGKKNGCKNPVMVKENQLKICVLNSTKSYINSIVSFDEMLSKMSAENINSSLTKKYTNQICENEKRLEKIRRFKSSLYERFVNNFVTKEDYKYMKAAYDADYKKFSDAIDELKQELENAKNNTGERLKWIEHFKKYSGLQELDRKVVIQLIRSIKVVDKQTIEINFNFKDEYGNAVKVYPIRKVAM